MGGRSGISGLEVQYNAEISRRVEALRTARGIGPSELARAAGVTPPMLYNYQVGMTRWPVFRLRLIADYLQVSIDQVLPQRKLM